MMKCRHIILQSLILLLIASCTKPYAPKAIASASNYLVIEGIINTGANDSTVIKLSRTVSLASIVGNLPETQATVSIQGDDNQTYSLNETTGGIYTSADLNLDNTHKYRLNITTSDGKTYSSDYLTPITTPPIDSIGFTIKSNGMQIYANTHDPTNNTHYYRWDYTETWEFHSEFFSAYITNGVSDMVPRVASQYIYQCWGNGLSTDIVLGSSAKLTQDVIYQSPITFVESTSEKIESRYSILVKQYAISSDGYNYFTQLKQNTEQLGGIFDPQPTQLTGNVHCTSNANIIAIGYVTAGTIQQKRVFIDNSQVPSDWRVTYPYSCQQDTALYFNKITHLNEVYTYLVPTNSDELATQAIFPPGSMTPIGYLYSSRDCTDCSIRGTLTKPSFWQ